VLYLEGTSIADDVRRFLADHAIEPTTRVARGTALPRPRTYHIPLSGPAIADLRRIAERHAEPEICDHLVVYRGEHVLVSAYDVGEIEVLLSRRLGPASLARFRASVES
jgi:hypothetical protein